MSSPWNGGCLPTTLYALVLRSLLTEAQARRLASWVAGLYNVQCTAVHPMPDSNIYGHTDFRTQ